MSVIKYVKSTLQKRATYRRTKFELETMPLDVALDLGLYREDAARIAAKAVYG